jgi:hypothetical protein
MQATRRRLAAAVPALTLSGAALVFRTGSAAHADTAPCPQAYLPLPDPGCTQG